ncbi:MAG: methylmalonyl-CoA mutase family protein [Candidatus Nanopelagicales bacterium]|nr:methylmalonyl-CoA mutase family protein [Candidatus Nanopelagicales bacterium]
MTSDRIPLLAGFPRFGRADWRELAAATLSGDGGPVDADEVERLMMTPTDDGYVVQALYTAADLASLSLRPAQSPQRLSSGRSGWSIRQRHWGSSEVAAAVADDLSNGVQQIWLTLSGAGPTPRRLRKILREIDLSRTAVTLEGFDRGEQAARQLLGAVPAGGDFADGTSLGLDPYGLLAGTGRTGDLDRVADLAREAEARGILAFSIDGTVYHDAGASFGDELGLTCAAGLEAMRLMLASGLKVDDAAKLLEFRVAATDDQFATIAKLRAARLIWNRVLQVLGAGGSSRLRLHAVTSWAMLTKRDPWVNVVRNCVAAFAAGVGNADAVTVLPHTTAVGKPDEFARRVARNTQHLLLCESRVGFVSDPAAGSWYVESRTRQMAEAAWAILQDVEGVGGLRAAIESGLVASRISRTRGFRTDRIAQRRAPITGVSEFPGDDLVPKSPGPALRRPSGGLPQTRYSQDWEELRDRSDAAAARGSRPKVHLVTLGPRSSHKPRQSFAANLFVAGGLECVVVPFAPGRRLGFPRRSPVVACLCGSDTVYQEQVTAAALACREAGARLVWLTGQPGDRVEVDGAAGIDAYVFAHCDGVATLRRAMSALGVR